MPQQTAVEFFYNQVVAGKIKIEPTKCGNIICIEDDVYHKALDLEKKQISNAFDIGQLAGVPITGEEYYQDVYKDDLGL